MVACGCYASACLGAHRHCLINILCRRSSSGENPQRHHLAGEKEQMVISYFGRTETDMNLIGIAADVDTIEHTVKGYSL